MEEITKVIIPAAGYGTRFLPYTKTVPKEMLPLLDQPAIQTILEEGIASAIKNYIIVTSKHKHSMTDFLAPHQELDQLLKEKNKESLLDALNRVIKQAEFTYVFQQEQLGLGHAVLLAKHCIQREYFGIMLPDDIIISKQPALDQLMRIAHQEKASVIAIQEVPLECAPSYGMIEIKRQITSHLFQVNSIVEKPAQKNTPSNLAVIGRYVLSHKIFNSLEQIKHYAVEEIQLTDGITHLLQNNEKVFAYKVQGLRYDIGTPTGWIKAIIGLALQHPHYQGPIKRFINELGTVDSPLYNQSKNIEHSL